MAGLVAGAMSMAAGEYVSVSSQSDTECADLDRERKELATDHTHEHAELSAIYVARGLDADLANKVAAQLMSKDALAAHARDELGISETVSARPVQAAFASAATFALGATMPLVIVLFAPTTTLVWTVSASSLFFLALLGSLAARAGGFADLEIGRPRDLLGSAGDGADSRCWGAIWGEALTSQTRLKTLKVTSRRSAVSQNLRRHFFQLPELLRG
jgi:hypothetical protein